MGTPPDDTDRLFDDAFMARLDRLAILSRRIVNGASAAMRRSRRIGPGIDVADYRPWVDGDDLRHVDWNYYAGTRELLVRLYEEEEDLRIWLLVDASPSMRIGTGRKFDHARQIAAALAWVALTHLDRVAVLPFGETIAPARPPARGRAQIHAILRGLGRPTLRERTDLRATLRTFVASTRQRGIVVVLSDLYDPAGVTEALAILRHNRFEPIVLPVWDEADLEPDLSGDLELVDCETGATVSLRVTPDLLARYRAAHEALLVEVETWCRAHAVLCFRAPVQLPLEELVLRIFRAGGFLR